MLAGSGFCIDKFYVGSALLCEPAFAMRGRYNSFLCSFLRRLSVRRRRSLFGQPDVRAPCKLGATGLQRQVFRNIWDTHALLCRCSLLCCTTYNHPHLTCQAKAAQDAGRVQEPCLFVWSEAGTAFSRYCFEVCISRILF